MSRHSFLLDAWLPDREPPKLRPTTDATTKRSSGHIGNLVEDPEVRFANTGIAVANLRVAVTQRVQQDGEWRDGDTSFLKVNVWRGQAEHLADSLAKGERSSQRRNADRTQGRERQTERGRDLDDPAPTY